MDSNTLEGRKAQIEETMDSGEFFLSGMRTRISNLQTKRDSLKAVLSGLEAEERALKLKQTKLKGLQISQDSRHRQENESTKSEFRHSEELLWASKLDKEEKFRKLELDVETIKKKKGIISSQPISL
jgi:hypothetical protein